MIFSMGVSSLTTEPTMKTTPSRLLTLNALCRIDTTEVDRITVEAGTAWVTVSGHAQDIFLHPGDTLAIAPSCLTIVEGLSENTRLRLHSKANGEQHAAKPARPTPRRAPRALVAKLRQWALGTGAISPSV